jgi:hypothetical protein
MKRSGILCSLLLAAVAGVFLYLYMRMHREEEAGSFALAERYMREYGIRDIVNKPETLTIGLILETADLFFGSLVPNSGRLFLDIARRNEESKHVHKLKELVGTSARSMSRMFSRRMDKILPEQGGEGTLEEQLYSRMLLLFFRVHKMVRLSNLISPEIVKAEMAVLRNSGRLRRIDDDFKLRLRQNKQVYTIGLVEYFYRYMYVQLASIFRLVELCEHVQYQ